MSPRNAGVAKSKVWSDIVKSGMGGADLYAWITSERPELKVLFIWGFMSREPLGVR